MRYSSVLIALMVMGLLCCACASALTEAEVSQLVFVDHTELPRLMADRVQFLSDGHAAVGGWFEWPNSPVVAVFPNDLPAMQLGTQAASPRFALAPDRKSLAFWRRVKIGDQDKAELTVIRLDNQMVTTLGEPVSISDSMHLAWPGPNGPIVYATEDTQRRVGNLYALDLMGGKPRKVLELHDGQWRELLPAAAPGTVVAKWAGTTTAAYAVTCLPGEYVPPVGASLTMACPDGTSKTLEIDGGNQLVLGLSPTEGVVVDRDVRAAKWRPDGKAILYVKDKQVLVVGPTGATPRLLATVPAQDSGVFLRGCTWSTDGIGLAYWGTAGASGRAWRASLGLERITARFTFGKGAPVKADDRLWVVSKFQRDAFGNIIEPVWNTLKGSFVVTRILRTPEGVIADPLNSGTQGGLIERLSVGTAPVPSGTGHISIAVAGQPAATWSRTSTLQFRPELVGWLEKTKYVGQPGILTVERQVLGEAGAL